MYFDLMIQAEYSKLSLNIVAPFFDIFLKFLIQYLSFLVIPQLFPIYLVHRAISQFQSISERMTRETTTPITRTQEQIMRQ